MHKFVRNLITEWRRLSLPFADETVVIAISGGADSLSLLLALDDLKKREKLRLRFVAAHFNHKLRGRQSDADEEFVKQIVAKRDFELTAGHGPVKSEGNLEQNARNARYSFLAETAETLRAGYVLTAHTINDQAETFLLNLIRGSGVDGLSAMPAVRELERGEGREPSHLPNSSTPRLLPSSPLLARPLLRWARREDTENFCRESGVEFRYDTMNEDMSFKRVRVRKMLLPMLKEFNPNIIEALAQTAELMRQGSVPGAIATGSIAEREVATPPAQSGGGHPSLNEEGGLPNENAATESDLEDYLTVKELKSVPQSILYQNLRAWLKARRGSLSSISLKHIEAVERLIHSKKSGRIVELPGKCKVLKRNGKLEFHWEDRLE